jgi:hypothetical protein
MYHVLSIAVTKAGNLDPTTHKYTFLKNGAPLIAILFDVADERERFHVNVCCARKRSRNKPSAHSGTWEIAERALGGGPGRNENCRLQTGL